MTESLGCTTCWETDRTQGHTYSSVYFHQWSCNFLKGKTMFSLWRVVPTTLLLTSQHFISQLTNFTSHSELSSWWLMAVRRTWFALISAVSLSINKVELSYTELTLRRQMEQLSAGRWGMTAPDEGWRQHRNKAAFRAGLGVCVEELLLSNTEWSSSHTKTHKLNGVSTEWR